MNQFLTLILLELTCFPLFGMGVELDEEYRINLRPTAYEFAYHKHIPQLHTLAIKNLPQGATEMTETMPRSDGLFYYRMPESLRTYVRDFICAHTHSLEGNVKESVSLEMLNKKISIFTYRLYDLVGHDSSYAAMKRQLEHADLTTKMQEGLLLRSAGYNGKLVAALVQAGVRGEFFTRWQGHPLHDAVVWNDLEKATRLADAITVNESIAISEPLFNNITPLAFAAAYGYVNIIKALINYATPKTKDDAFLHAVYKGTNITIKSLVDGGVDINVSVGSRIGVISPLHLAAGTGDIQMVEELIRIGADVNKINDLGETPLYEVSRLDIEMAQLLLSHGVDINWGNNRGETCLHKATSYRYPRMAQFLLEHGASINQTDNNGQTPLHWVFQDGDLETLQLLLSYGADVNCANNLGDTPLHKAVRYGPVDRVGLLIEYGAHINQINKKGKTPLDCVSFHRESLIQLLMKHGAKHGAEKI